MRLFHVSDDPGITRFYPRPVRVEVERGADRAWLNGPLVWAIDAAHGFLYLFPRDCPRIVIWATSDTSPEDREAWFGGQTCRAIAYVEHDWRGRLAAATVHRYLLPPDTFEDLHDVGMWVSREAVVPLGVERLGDLPAAIEAEGVALRSLPRLTPLRSLWSTTLHASGIRLRNAQDWGGPGPVFPPGGRAVLCQSYGDVSSNP